MLVLNRKVAIENYKRLQQIKLDKANKEYELLCPNCGTIIITKEKEFHINNDYKYIDCPICNSIVFEIENKYKK